MKISYLVIILLLLTPVILAGSNESIEASEFIAQAKQDLIEMQDRQISTNRANESYQEALQLYDAQMALERLHKNAKFDLIKRYTTEVTEIKRIAFEAQDELTVFIEVFDSANQSADLSSMFDDYNAVILSFNEERFEDTIKLIEGGYDKLSEVQSSQTTINLFYTSTTKTLKNFFKTQWKTIILVISVILLFLFLFWKAISRIKLHLDLQNLRIQKESIKKLLKKLQSDYFIHKNISASSYNIKLKKFGSMILDIDRQIPLLRESAIKLKEKEKATRHLSIGKGKGMKVKKMNVKKVKKTEKKVKKAEKKEKKVA